MSQLTIPRGRAPRAAHAWIDTGLRYCLTAVCAGSAGVHAALIWPHFLESAPLGWAFTAAAATLAAAALAVRQPRHDSWAIAAAAAALCLIAVSYLLSRTAGIPLLIVAPEHADPLGAITTAAELTGALCGAVLLARRVQRSRKDQR